MTIIPFAKETRPCCRTDSPTTVTRLSLPVAPRANCRIRFASVEKAPEAMMPEEAMAWLDYVRKQGIKVDRVGITGPGDPLAVPGPTMETLRLVRQKYPDIPLTISTLGIGGDQYADTLADIGITQVTVLVDAVSQEVAKKLYAWIRPGTKTVPLPKAVRVLLDEQARAVTAFNRAGLKVEIATTVYPGHNADHVEETAERMAALGAKTMALVPFRPAAEDDDTPPEPDGELMTALREAASRHIEICDDPEIFEADVINLTSPKGCVGNTPMLPKPTRERPNVAVATSNGMDVDLHLGHAIKVLIYGPREDGLPCLLGTRPSPEPGGGTSRWENLAATLSDCFALLTASAGEGPRKILRRRGISVLITEDAIEGTVDVLYGGGKKGGKGRR